MLVYRDRAFCLSRCCNDKCEWKLTPEIEFAAAEVDLPIEISDFSEICSFFVPLIDAQ